MKKITKAMMVGGVLLLGSSGSFAAQKVELDIVYQSAPRQGFVVAVGQRTFPNGQVCLVTVPFPPVSPPIVKCGNPLILPAGYKFNESLTLKSAITINSIKSQGNALDFFNAITKAMPSNISCVNAPYCKNPPTVVCYNEGNKVPCS